MRGQPGNEASNLPSLCCTLRASKRLKNFTLITCGATSLLFASNSKLEAVASWWLDEGCCKNPSSVSCRPFRLPFWREEILTPVKQQNHELVPRLLLRSQNSAT